MYKEVKGMVFVAIFLPTALRKSEHLKKNVSRQVKLGAKEILAVKVLKRVVLGS